MKIINKENKMKEHTEVNEIPINSASNCFKFKSPKRFRKLTFGFKCAGKDGETRELSFNSEVSDEDYNWMLDNGIIEKISNKHDK